MKLEYLNCSAIRKHVGRHKHRLATSFVISLNDHVTAVLDLALKLAQQEGTILHGGHAAAAITQLESPTPTLTYQSK